MNRGTRTEQGGRRRAMRLLWLVVVLGAHACGGANEADLGRITGETTRTERVPDRTPTGGAATPLPTGAVTASPVPTATAIPQPTATVQPAAMQFMGAVPPAVGVVQSGLPEQSVLTFRVTDALGRPVPGVRVAFGLVGLGDETLAPLEASTDGDGVAQTTLTTGVRTATVRIAAAADRDGDGTPDLFAQSTALAVLGAPPVQSRFSLAIERANVPGRRLFGVRNPVTAFVSDRFGNAVPPGTVVTMVSNGASVVGTPLTDGDGVAVGTVITEAAVPPSGIVTILAFTRGEEDYLDNNGNGVFDAGTDTLIGDDQPEPFIDFRPPAPLDAGCALPGPHVFCNGAFDPDRPFEQFVDANDNGIWDTQGRSGEWDNDILVFDLIPVTFSGDLATPTLMPETFTIPDGGTQTFTLEVHDDLGNPLAGGAMIEVTTNVGAVQGGSITVPDGQSFGASVPGLTRFTFVLGDDTPGDPMPAAQATLLVSITSENGGGSFVVASGTID